MAYCQLGYTVCTVRFHKHVHLPNHCMVVLRIILHLFDKVIVQYCYCSSFEFTLLSGLGSDAEARFDIMLPVLLLEMK